MGWAVRILAFGLLALIAWAPAPAWAERVALVIGNARYANAPPLTNPGNDARLVAQALRGAGFTTIDIQSDLSKANFDRALQTFRARADRAEIALIYYAGHGMEVGGRNWLVPVDAQLADERDLAFEAIDLDTVLRIVEGARGLRVVILDACRDNPFARSMRRSAGARSTVSRGLARVEVTDTLVVYAAKDGTTASDGTGANSPFAQALARRLPEAGVEINFVFRRVRDDVLRATNRAQEPFVYGSLAAEEMYLVPAFAPAPAPVSRDGGPFGLDLLHPDVRRAAVAARAAAVAAEQTAARAREAGRSAEAAAGRARGKGEGTSAWRNADGQGYEGEVANGLQSGVGVSTWLTPHDAAGTRYAGQLREGKRNGLGVYDYPESNAALRYEGRYVDDLRQGDGAYAWRSGDRYLGAFVSAAMAGPGVYTWADGARYEGEWANSKRDGYGVRWGADGRILQAGIWRDGNLVTPLAP